MWKKKNKQLINFTRYEKCQVNPSIIRDFTLDLPDKKKTLGTKPFSIMGWIVGGTLIPDYVELRINGKHYCNIPVNVSRLDVYKLYPTNPLKDRVGFFTYLNPFVLPNVFKLEIFVVNKEGSKTKLYQIEGRREKPPWDLPYNIGLLSLTTLGRTGSTVTLAYLGAHPEIAVYRPYQVEARYATYWIQMFLSLGNPKSWIYPISADNRADSSWIFGESISRPLHFALYGKLVEWFNIEYMESLYKFCLGSLQEHYVRVAGLTKKKSARYFCEKFLPNDFTSIALDIMPNSREIILVRDFRDMLCSIRAFNRKRGFDGFGREKFQSDEEYIRNLMAPSIEMLRKIWRKRKQIAFLLRYEDLIRNPEGALSNVFEYLGVDSSRNVIKKVIKRAKNMNIENQKAHQTAVDPEKSIGRFKNELEPSLLELCNSAFHAALNEFGYS